MKKRKKQPNIFNSAKNSAGNSYDSRNETWNNFDKNLEPNENVSKTPRFKNIKSEFDSDEGLFEVENYLGDFKHKADALERYFKKHVALVDRQRDALLDELDAVRETQSIEKLETLKDTSEREVSFGILFQQAVGSILDSIDESIKNGKVNDEYKDIFSKQFQEIGRKYSKGIIDITKAIEQIQDIISPEAEKGYIDDKVLDNVNSKLQTLNETKDITQKSLDRVADIVNSALQVSINDLSAKDLGALNNLTNNYLNKDAKEIDTSDLGKILETFGNELDEHNKALLNSLESSINSSEKMSEQIFQSMDANWDRLQAFDTEKYEKIYTELVNNQEFSVSEILKEINNLQENASSDLEISELKEISDTLKALLKLENSNQLSKADKQRKNMQEIRNEASLENMESYLQKLSENDKSAINMLSGVRGEGLDSLGESLGENLGDMLVDWGSDYFSAEKREARKKANERGKNRKKRKGLSRLLSPLDSILDIKDSISNKTSALTKGAGALGSSALKAGGSLLQGASKIAGPLAAALSVGKGIYDFTQAESGTERVDAVAGAGGSAVGGLIGGALGTVLGPVGSIAGAALGSWVGDKVGTWLGDKFKDPTDFIPDSAKVDAKTELNYIDTQLIPDIQKNPEKYNIKDKDDIDDAMDDVKEYRDDLVKKFEKENNGAKFESLNQENVQAMEKTVAEKEPGFLQKAFEYSPAGLAFKAGKAVYDFFGKEEPKSPLDFIPDDVKGDAEEELDYIDTKLLLDISSYPSKYNIKTNSEMNDAMKAIKTHRDKLLETFEDENGYKFESLDKLGIVDKMEARANLSKKDIQEEKEKPGFLDKTKDFLVNTALNLTPFGAGKAVYDFFKKDDSSDKKQESSESEADISEMKDISVESKVSENKEQVPDIVSKVVNSSEFSELGVIDKSKLPAENNKAAGDVGVDKFLNNTSSVNSGITTIVNNNTTNNTIIQSSPATSDSQLASMR